MTQQKKYKSAHISPTLYYVTGAFKAPLLACDIVASITTPEHKSLVAHPPVASKHNGATKTGN